MNLYPLTLKILKDAYRSETTASLHYRGYSARALVENYPNIAYLFHALSVSEKIHADNYQTLITLLGSTLVSDPVTVFCASTQKNLNTAAVKELEKINTFYPEVLKKLSAESHQEAVEYAISPCSIIRGFKGPKCPGIDAAHIAKQFLKHPGYRVSTKTNRQEAKDNARQIGSKE